MSKAAPLLIRQAVVEDAPSLTQIKFSCHLNNPLASVLLPEGATPTFVEASDEAYEKVIRNGNGRDGKDEIIIVAQRDGDDRILGFARWKLVHEETQVEKADTPDELQLSDKEDSALETFGRLIDGKRALHTSGKPHLCLSQLFVDASIQRQGIGRQLTAHGLRTLLPRPTSDLSYFAYLEASPAGLTLYRQLGFEEVDHFDFDLSKYRGKLPSAYRTVIMIKPAPTTTRRTHGAQDT